MKSKMNLTFIIFAIINSYLFSSCKNQVNELTIKKRNATDYIFNIPKDRLYKKILSDINFFNTILITAEDKRMALPEISKLFSQPNNDSDFCIMPVGFVCKSQIYFTINGDSLDYRAWFYLHLEKDEIGKTRVTIKTFKPEIKVGRDILPTPPHFVRAIKTLAVKPSSIEEYVILLTIGKYVGERNMPSIILPESNSKKQKIN